jgi:pimeloyl-ACP methyl ester carboxylesterase/DNA-binding CsgD family transcriptional regulator
MPAEATVQPPQTRYARSGDVRIAYQVIGNGAVDLVFVPGFISNLDVHWEDPGYSHLLRRLGAFARLIQFDKRGTGLSDRVDIRHLPSLETRMDDVRAVMDAAGSGRAVLLGASEGAPMSILFAATYPERTRALVLYGGYAHFHSWVLAPAALSAFIRGIEAGWGSGASLASFAPERVDDPHFRAWWARFERLSASPSAALALARMNAEIDVRPVLKSIRVPTLLLHRSNDARVRIAGGRYLAEHIKGARFVEIPGRDHPIWTGDIDRVVDEIEEFVTGSRPVPAFDRVLATIVAVRLVAAPRAAVKLGDRQWSERLHELREAVHDECARFGGSIAAAGAEEISARFDGPARAVRCAIAVRDLARTLRLELAVGVHAGEVEVHGATTSGVAVHVAARIAARARTGDVLVTGTVKDLVPGSGLRFETYGTESIEGFDSPLPLFIAADERTVGALGRAAARPELDALSTREREVLALVAAGLSNAAIAKRLHISEHTVKRHVANILGKLDLPTRAAAAAVMGRSA